MTINPTLLSDVMDYSEPLEFSEAIGYGLQTALLGMGVIFVGDEGILEADYGTIRLYPTEKYAKYERPAQTIPASAGHHREWINSIIDGGKSTPLCNFEYAGRLSEAVQLGAVSLRAGKVKLEWDAKAMKIVNNADANKFLQTEYREGWDV